MTHSQRHIANRIRVYLDKLEQMPNPEEIPYFNYNAHSVAEQERDIKRLSELMIADATKLKESTIKIA